VSTVSTEVLQPYASALMSLAQSSNLSEKFGEDIRSLLSLLEGSEDLRQFLAIRW